MSFDNAFEDYSLKSFRSIFNDDKQLKPDSAIRKESDIFWSKVNIIYKNINKNDNSVFTGTCGVALLMLRKSVTSPELLNDALNYLNLDKLKERHVSFLCGDAGPLAIGAILYYKLGNKSESAKLIERLISLNADVLNPKSDLPNELLYGRVGYLYALLFINTHIEPAPVDDKLIREIISVTLSVGKCEARHSNYRVPLMYQWHSKYYLGAAHGLSGIMYILLQAAQYLSKYELHELIKPTVDYLTKQRYESGNYMSSLGSHTDKLVQWCHGAPGFTHMYCKAYEVLKDEKYLKFALECGEIVWERGLLRKGYSICHGVAGNAYTFLQLFQTTQDIKHLYRAARFAEWCTDYNAEHERHRPDRPLSLFEGIAGRLYLLEEMTDPMHAKFPGYTI